MSRVLILDNDATHRGTLAELLRNAGYVVIGTDSVQHASEMLEVQVFDLLLLEVALQDGHGFELCNALRERVGDDMVIMFITIDATPLCQVVGLQMGADDVVVKPYAQEELLTRIKAHLRRTHVRRLQRRSYSQWPQFDE